MTRISTTPFRLPRPERVTPGRWIVSWAGQSAEDPEKLDSWEYAADLNLLRSLEVDVEGVLADCGLPAGATLLGVACHWRSTWTNLRGCSPVAPVSPESSVLHLELPGSSLGGTLHLETRLVLGAPVRDAPPLAPKRAGSILWRETSSVILEGEAPRFPMQSLDFSNLGAQGAAGGAWFLQWHPDDLEGSTLGTMRLLVNSHHPMVERLVGEGDDTSPELRAVASILRYDVVRQLVNGALDNPGFDDAIEWAPRSVGETLAGLLDVLFPGETVADLRGFRLLAPELFEVRIQSAARLLQDV